MSLNRVPGVSSISAPIRDGLVLQTGPSAGVPNNLIVPPDWAASGTIKLPPNPADGDIFTFFDCFEKVTPANSITIDGNGYLICGVHGGTPPVATFLWLGMVQLAGLITVSDRWFYLQFCRNEGQAPGTPGVWCCSCIRVELDTGPTAGRGHATLVGGTVVVPTAQVTAGSVILLTGNTGPGAGPGELSVTARTPGVNFTIASANGADNRDVGWFLLG